MRKFLSSRFGFSIITNSITVFISYFLFHPYWEEIDDIWIAAYTEGAFGAGDPHVLFSNIIYAHILCLLGQIMPVLRWHAVLEILFIFIASTAFVYILSKTRQGRFWSVIFLSGTFYEIYVALQFSKIPAFTAVVGYVILFELCMSEDIPGRKTLLITAWLLLLFAMLLRPESFLLATMIAGLYGIIIVIFESVNRTLLHNIKHYCTHFIPVFVAFAICSLTDRLGYTGQEWIDFKETWELTESMIDYHHNALLYDVHAHELEEIGVSENDAFMFITWQYGDDEYLNADLLQKIISIDSKGLGSVDIYMLKLWAENIYNTIFVVNPLILAIVMVLGSFAGKTLLRKQHLFNTVVIITQSILTLSVLFYYQYSERWSHRIVYALLLSQFILLLFIMSRENIEENLPGKAPASAYAVIAVMLFSLVHARLTNEFEYQEYLRSTPDYPAVISYMQHNKDKLFVADTFTLQGYDKYNIFKAAGKGQFDNLTLVGWSYANSPMDKAVVRSHEYENPFKALEGRDFNVILIDNLHADKKLNYCNEHGDGSVYALKEADNIGNLHMYYIL